MPVIYSKLSCDQKYSQYNPAGKGRDAPVPQAKEVGKGLKFVLVKGGSGIADRKTMITPNGVATVVTGEQLEYLKGCNAFTRHVERGYLKVDEKASSATDPAVVEKAVKELQSSDGSAPVTSGATSVGGEEEKQG